MKKLIYALTFLTISTLFYSCASSINVVNKWTAENSEGTLKDKNILVIARAANEKVRMAFEDEMAKQLRAKGFNATESYKKHPNLKSDQKMTAEKKVKVKKVLEEEGYNSVVLSVLKDKLENIKSTEGGGYYAGQSLKSYYPPYIPVYSYGFYGGYGFSSGYLYNTKTYQDYGTYVESSVETETTNSYVLETLAYNLELAEDKQLVAYVTTRIDEPDNYKSAAKGNTQKILESFKK
ncbi:hypothetical protein ACFQ5N_05135 [Lutibacter holmesii]|uniref:DUF4136 domain-containing protein n=1 Tax=Lutibacter holmesii TaxID=1137985 RepID=A0ABW3WPJ7_9FLAO